MNSSGQFVTDFVAELECVDCGVIAEVDVTYDPETIQPYLYVCPNGHENRPEFETDPDAGRDDL